MKVLMVGVDERTKGGMWTVVDNYLQDDQFVHNTGLKYIPTSTVGSNLYKIVFTLIAMLKVCVALLTSKYDIVHIHVSERGSIYRKSLVALLGRMARCKIIAHMHGAEFEVWHASASRTSKQLVKWFLNHCDKILILGNYCRQYVEKIVENPQKIEIVYNAVTVGDVNPYNRGAKHLMFLGEVGKRKGIIDLLDAIQQIDDQLPTETKMKIYGPQGDIIVHEEISKRGLDQRVVYLGWLSKDCKKDVFSEIAVNILPSYNEGLPMTILETMACGIPNISTRVAGIPEVVDEQNGVCIEAGDVNSLAQGILNIVQDEQLRIQKSENAYRTVRNTFLLKNHISRIYQIYMGVQAER